MQDPWDHLHSAGAMPSYSLQSMWATFVGTRGASLRVNRIDKRTRNSGADLAPRLMGRQKRIYCYIIGEEGAGTPLEWRIRQLSALKRGQKMVF